MAAFCRVAQNAYKGLNTVKGAVSHRETGTTRIDGAGAGWYLIVVICEKRSEHAPPRALRPGVYLPNKVTATGGNCAHSHPNMLRLCGTPTEQLSRLGPGASRAACTAQQYSRLTPCTPLAACHAGSTAWSASTCATPALGSPGCWASTAGRSAPRPLQSPGSCAA